MLPFDLETVVLCDDIRQESNGKYLLIGVYGGNIVVQSFPNDLRLAIWLLGRPRKSGTFRARIRIVGPQEAILADGKFELNVNDTKVAIIMALPGVPIQAQREGKMRIELAGTDEDNWTVVKTVDLTLAPRTTPSG